MDVAAPGEEGLRLGGLMRTLAVALLLGALASVDTTVLMRVEETLEALEKGKGIGYLRPGE